MTVDFDPRAWNLLAGLTVVAGCGSHLISLDGDSNDSINDGETTQNPDSGSDSGPDSSTDSGPETGTETGPECIDETDCPLGYYCYDGVCEYVPYDDGHVPYYDCYSDYDCGPRRLCELNYCQYVDTPVFCELVLAPGPVFEFMEPVLALAFVDVDNDGARELVAATQAQLLVMENGSPTPVAHPRGIESATVHAMVGGAFDAMAGEDVIVLHDDELDLHGSDGLGNLAPALPSMTPYPVTVGLEAGAFDAEPMTDLLAWGESTSAVIYGSGEVLGLLDALVSSASARDLGTPGNGFTLLHENELVFVDIGGFITGSVVLRGGSPAMQASVDTFGEPREVGSSNFGIWTLIEVFDRLTSNFNSRWSLLGVVTLMRSGDLDGDGSTEEIAMIVDNSLWLYLENTCRKQVPLDGAVTAIVFGDHDGDGDDELAVSSSSNTVSIIDVE